MMSPSIHLSIVSTPYKLPSFIFQMVEQQDHHHLLQPLIPTTTSPAAAASGANYHKDVDNIKIIISSNSGIIFRFLLIIFVGTVSIWANYEASKGFTITIINDAGNSSPGKRFSLFYVSNDKATRIVLSTSQFIENFLYPEDHHIRSQSHPKKQVNHVILRLAAQNLTTKFYVESRKYHEYVLHLSPSIMDEPNFNHAFVSAVQKGTLRIWLWDGQGNAPRGLINGMIEYISSLEGFAQELNSGHHGKLPEYSDIDSCWNDKDPRAVAQLLDDCEKQNVGFIGRLNQAMENDWRDSIGSNCMIESNKCYLVSHSFSTCISNKTG